MLLTFYKKLGFATSSALILLLVGLFFINFGEKITINNGAGFDGIYYVYIVQNYEKLSVNGGFNKPIPEIGMADIAKTDRFFPSLLVYHGMKFLAIPLEWKNVIRAYEYQNLIWLLLASLAWTYISAKFSMQDLSRWLGFVFFFGSYAYLKFNYFYPALTDTAAACMTMLLIAFFVQNSWLGKLGMVAIAVAGAFTWQPITVYAYILLLFPKNTPLISEKNKITKGINWAIWILPSFFFLYGFWTNYKIKGIETFKEIMNDKWGAVPIDVDSFWLSLVLALVFTFFYFKYLFENASLNNFKYLYKSSDSQNNTDIILGIAAKIIPIALIYVIAGQFHQLFSDQTVATTANSVADSDIASGAVVGVATSLVTNPLATFSNYIFNALSLHFPLEFLVNSAVYFSPAMIVGFIFYPKLAENLRKEGGIGILLVFVASYGTSFLNPQSRIMTAFAPFLLVFITLMIDRLNWEKKYYYFLMVITLIASKAWLIFGTEWQTPTGMGKSWTMLMMNQGTWAAKKWYMMHTLFFILIAIFFVLNRKTLLGIERLDEKIVPEPAKDLGKKKK